MAPVAPARDIVRGRLDIEAMILKVGARTSGLHITALCLCLTAVPAIVGAQESQRQSQQEELAEQRREKAERLQPERVSSWEGRVRSLEEANFPSNILVQGFNGFRPVIGGLPSGSGFVGGVGWGHGVEGEWYEVDAAAVYSTRGFQTVECQTGPRQRAKPFPNPRVRDRCLPRLPGAQALRGWKRQQS